MASQSHLYKRVVDPPPPFSQREKIFFQPFEYNISRGSKKPPYKHQIMINILKVSADKDNKL